MHEQIFWHLKYLEFSVVFHKSELFCFPSFRREKFVMINMRPFSTAFCTGETFLAQFSLQYNVPWFAYTISIIISSFSFFYKHSSLSLQKIRKSMRWPNYFYVFHTKYIRCSKPISYYNLFILERAFPAIASQMSYHFDILSNNVQIIPA